VSKKQTLEEKGTLFKFKRFQFKGYCMKNTMQYGKKADLALSLWVKLARACATFEQLTQRDIDRYGLTGPQFAVLDALGHLGKMTMGDLGRKMLVSGGNVTVVVDNLERDGVVHRTHSHEDRRTVVVDLTPKGRKLFREIFPQHARFVTTQASVLSEEEQRELARLLKKLGTACRQHQSNKAAS
jgi:MarR family 2-MHQ and catechol resistance regulon transcriptional repressor